MDPLRDLPSKKDPKGGSPKTPNPIPRREYDDETTETWTRPFFQRGDSGSVWRTLALSLLTANLTAIGYWLIFGLDSVKHSEIDTIMATRAPYIHDKERIQENLDSLKRRDSELSATVADFRKEFKDNDAAVLNRLQELELKYYRDHPDQPRK